MKLDTPNPARFKVEPVQFKNQEEKYKFVSDLLEEIESVLQGRGELEKQWEVGILQYNSRLQREDLRQGSIDSNIDIPTTRKLAVGTEARLINPIFMYDRVYSCTARYASDLKFVRALEDAIDWMVDKVDFRKFCHLSVKHSQVFSKAVCKMQAQMCKEKRLRYVDVMIDTLDPMSGQPIQKPTGEKKAEVADEEYLKVFPEIIPTEDFIHPDGDVIADMPWVTHRLRKTKRTLKRELKSGRMYGEKFGGDADFMDVLANPEGVDKKDKFSLKSAKTEGESESSADKTYEILEIYTQYDDREIIITTERHAGAGGRVMRCVYNWFETYPRPFTTFEWEPVQGTLDGTSLCYTLESLHRGRSASFNQRLDAASRANEVAVFTDLDDVAKRFKDEPFRGGIYKASSAMLENIRDHFHQVNFMQPYTQLQTLEADMSNEAAEVANIPPYLQGKETTDRPTATGQVKLIEEAMQPHFERIDRFREYLNLVARMMVSRYKQYFPDGMTYYTAGLELADLDQQEAQMQPQGQMQGPMQGPQQPQQEQTQAVLLKEMLNWPSEFWEDQVIVETRVSSQNMSRSMRKQELLALTDKVISMTKPLMELVSAATTPSPMSLIAEKLVKLVTAHAKDMLTEFDSPHAAMIDMEGELNAGKQLFEIIQQLQQQLQKMQGQMQQMDQAGQQLAQENAMLKGQPPQGGPPPPAALGPPGMGPGGGGPPGQNGGVQPPPGMGGGPVV